MLKSSLIALAICLASCQSVKEGPPLNDSVQILSASDNREISVRFIEPEGCVECPVVIFSHGANAAFDRYESILIPLAKSGFRIAAPNHVDSEEHLNRDKYNQNESLPLRVEDYDVLADYFQTDNLFVMGHSYGALIAQMAGGFALSGPSSSIAVKSNYRPKAIVAISPPGPFPGYLDKIQSADFGAPMLIVTGTTDIVPGIAPQWEDHLVSFHAAGDDMGYALIYDNMDHYFNGTYGRIREAKSKALSTERDEALSHLNSAIVSFIDATQTSPHSLTSDWSKQSTTTVSARAKKRNEPHDE